MKAVIWIVAMMASVGAWCECGCGRGRGCRGALDPWGQNVIDGKQDFAYSRHCGHVASMVNDNVTLADGTMKRFDFTGGTNFSPYTTFGPGTLCVIVPSYGSDGHTYYLDSYKLDVKP